MFHLLLVNFSKVTSEKVQNICSQSADFVLYESNSLEKAISFCKQIKIHCVLLMPDPDFIYAKRFMTFLRKFPTSIHTPVILLSSQIAHILQVIPQWNFIEIFMLPLSTEKERELAHLINYYHLLFQQTKDFTSRLCQISTAKGIYSFPYEEILFIEIVMKKAIFHLRTKEVVFTMPLYKIRETMQSSYMVQTHRSFIVNLSNISYLDKTKNPWELSFFHSDQHAYVSRGYKKQFLSAISSLFSND